MPESEELRPRSAGAARGRLAERLAEAEFRLAARSRELDLLQALGRQAAEARTPEALFRGTVEVLERVAGLDVVLAAHDLDAEPYRAAFLSRPWTDAALGELTARAGAFLGESGSHTAAPRRVLLEAYDAARGERGIPTAEETLLLPLMRRELPAACLLAVPEPGSGEGALRLLFSAANQLALHLDRILTVREAEADRFRAIVDSMPQGVLLVDAGLRVAETNRAAREMLAGAAIDLAQLGLEAHVREVHDGGRACAETEIRYGERVWNVSVSPLREDGGPSGSVVVLDDVTERRRLQLQLAQSEKMSSLGQLISGVTHELNNPLATILGYAQLLGASTQDEPLAQRLAILRREAERCRKIVQNLLSFARQREPETRMLSPNQIVRGVLDILQYQLRVHDVEVRVALDPDTPALRGDAHQLEQVVVNLMTNAEQALRRAKGGGTIEIATRRGVQGGVVIEVTDDGPGIPEEQRSRIFDPFFTTKPAGEGTGLGLSLVYGIVAAHGGTVQALAGPDGGARFRIDLPAAGAETSAPAERRAAAPAPSSGARILVVDDEEDLARLICETLRDDGHRPERAPDGREALRRLVEGEFDLVVSDIKMPGMDGTELLLALRRLRPGLERRVLLMTGAAAGSELDTQAGCAGVEPLRKPFDLVELRRRVHVALGADRGS